MTKKTHDILIESELLYIIEVSDVYKAPRISRMTRIILLNTNLTNLTNYSCHSCNSCHPFNPWFLVPSAPERSEEPTKVELYHFF